MGEEQLPAKVEEKTKLVRTERVEGTAIIDCTHYRREDLDALVSLLKNIIPTGELAVSVESSDSDYTAKSLDDLAQNQVAEKLRQAIKIDVTGEDRYVALRLTSRTFIRVQSQDLVWKRGALIMVRKFCSRRISKFRSASAHLWAIAAMLFGLAIQRDILKPATWNFAIVLLPVLVFFVVKFNQKEIGTVPRSTARLSKKQAWDRKEILSIVGPSIAAAVALTIGLLNFFK